MNVQAVRLALAKKLPDYFPGWVVLLGAWDPINATKTVQIGHSAPGPDTYKSKAADIPITLWVNESNQREAVNDMYVALSLDSDTAVRRMLDEQVIVRSDVEQIGPRQEGPSGFIAADLVWRIRAANT